MKKYQQPFDLILICRSLLGCKTSGSRIVFRMSPHNGPHVSQATLTSFVIYHALNPTMQTLQKRVSKVSKRKSSRHILRFLNGILRMKS